MGKSSSSSRSSSSSSSQSHRKKKDKKEKKDKKSKKDKKRDKDRSKSRSKSPTPSQFKHISKSYSLDTSLFTLVCSSVQNYLSSALPSFFPKLSPSDIAPSSRAISELSENVLKLTYKDISSKYLQIYSLVVERLEEREARIKELKKQKDEIEELFRRAQKEENRREPKVEELERVVAKLEHKVDNKRELLKNFDMKFSVLKNYHLILLKKYRLLCQDSKEYSLLVNSYDKNIIDLNEGDLSKRDKSNNRGIQHFDMEKDNRRAVNNIKQIVDHKKSALELKREERKQRDLADRELGKEGKPLNYNPLLGNQKIPIKNSEISIPHPFASNKEEKILDMLSVNSKPQNGTINLNDFENEEYGQVSPSKYTAYGNDKNISKHFGGAISEISKVDPAERFKENKARSKERLNSKEGSRDNSKNLRDHLNPSKNPGFAPKGSSISLVKSHQLVKNQAEVDPHLDGSSEDKELRRTLMGMKDPKQKERSKEKARSKEKLEIKHEAPEERKDNTHRIRGYRDQVHHIDYNRFGKAKVNDIFKGNYKT